MTTKQAEEPKVDVLELLDMMDDDATLETGMRYPVIAWRSGKQSMSKVGGVAYHGGWVVGKDSPFADFDFASAGWEEDEFTTESGDDVPVWTRKSIEVAVIQYRSRWKIEGGATFPRTERDAALAASPDGKATGQTHVLAIVKGLEELGPVVISVSGHAAMSFLGVSQYQKDGVLPRIKSCIIRKADLYSKEIAKAKGKKSTKRWGPLAVYAPVGVEFNDKGKPVFQEVGKGETSFVVLPHYVGPEDIGEAGDWLEYFVGRDRYLENLELFKESREWVAEWDRRTVPTDGEDEDEDSEPESVAAEEIDEDDALGF